MLDRFAPKSPDHLINNGADSTNAKFGHLNAVVDYINAVPPGGGIESVTGSAVDNTDPLNPVINIDGEFLPTAGGTMDSGATINFNSGARLQQGTTDAGIGGNGGIALRCSIDYELKWEAGRLFVMHQDGFIIREVRYTGIAIPTPNDDVTIGFVQNSRWVLDNGDTYVCNDPTENEAVWELYQVNQIGITDVNGYGVLQAEDSFGLKVKSDNAAFQGIYYNEDNSANYTESSLITRKDAPRIIRENQTPCDANNIPVELGDLYFDHSNSDLYYSFATIDCSNWKKLSTAISGTYGPVLVGPTMQDQQIDFLGQMFWTNVDGMVNCKGRFSLLMGSNNLYTFKINLPLNPPSGFGLNTQIMGSVVPFGTGILFNQVEHTSVNATQYLEYSCADFYIEVDSTYSGTCQFVYDFSYQIV